MSYVSQQFLLYDNSSLANFKNWAQAISTAFSSSGWTQTTDTGQVNWGTIASVPTAGNFVYEIWQPADALQTGSTAFYVKIFYGTSSGSPGGPRIKVQIGAGTDGSGNLTGITTTVAEGDVGTTVGGGSLTSDCYFSGDIDRFHFMMWRGANTTATQIVSIERTHNTDGTNISDGVTLICIGPNGGANQGVQVLVFGIGTTQSGTRFYWAIVDNGNASGAFNNNVPVSPTFPIYGKIGNPLTGIGWVHTQDVAEGGIFTTTLYGSTRTYIASANNSTNAGGASGSCRVCMRYD